MGFWLDVQVADRGQPRVSAQLSLNRPRPHRIRHWTLPTPESLTDLSSYPWTLPTSVLDVTDATPGYPLDSPDESNSLNLIPSE
jgi:hypothetical protein